MIIELNINDAIKSLNKRYTDREEFAFMKKIDALVTKIDILNNIKHWIFFVEEKSNECYIKKLCEEHNKILEDAEFSDEIELYFLYKIMLELHEFSDSIKIKIEVYTGNLLDVWKTKIYFQKLLNSFGNINLSIKGQIDNLDKLGKEIGSHNIINIHGNTTNLSANLLGINKHKSFRPNNTADLKYKIKTIGRDYVKVISCPVCGDKKTLYWNNKNMIFKSKSTKVTFICDHIGSDFYDKCPVVIDLKEYKKQIKGIDELDWVIYNYPQLFELFMHSINTDFE